MNRFLPALAGSICALLILAGVSSARLPGLRSTAPGSSALVSAIFTMDGGTRTLSSNAIANFDYKIEDTANAVTFGPGNEWRFTTPAGMGGLYEVCVHMKSSSAPSDHGWSLLKNGAIYLELMRAPGVQNPVGCVNIRLAPTDYIQWYLFTTDSYLLDGTRNSTWTSVVRLGS